MTQEEEIFQVLMVEAREVLRLQNVIRERDAEVRRLEARVADRDHRIFVLTAECSARAAATRHYRETLDAVRVMSQAVQDELAAVYEDLQGQAEDRRKRAVFVKTILETKN